MKAQAEVLSPRQEAGRQIDRRLTWSQRTQRTLFGLSVVAGVLGGAHEATDGNFGIPLEAGIGIAVASVGASPLERRSARRRVEGIVRSYERDAGADPGSRQRRVVDGRTTYDILPTRHPLDSVSMPLVPLTGFVGGVTASGFQLMEHSTRAAELVLQAGLPAILGTEAAIFHHHDSQYHRRFGEAAQQQLDNVDANVASQGKAA